MASPSITYLLLLCAIGFLIMLRSKKPYVAATESQDSDLKLYIVYMGDVPSLDKGYSHVTATSMHHNLLESILRSRKAAQKSLTYSYGKSFNGFAAWLSPQHAQMISNMHGVVSIFENKKLQLHTTKSWDFVGLPPYSKPNDLPYQSDVIVGVLDTGIFPESESFNDTGFRPVPSKWRGVCQTTLDFPSCNKLWSLLKIIGARFYHSRMDNPLPGEYFSPRDSEGHGTHTSSTAAGNFVRNVSLYGIAQGDARGGVPGARIAIYKVCWVDGCSDADILSAFDDAIYDGVDIISISIGSSFANPYFMDSIAIGSFYAMKKGILTSNSAGNSGPDEGSVSNISPWSLTVAASTIDRHMKAQLLLGNGIAIDGHAINTFSMENTWYPLIYGEDAANTSGSFTSDDSRVCLSNSLDSQKVEGKIVLCFPGRDRQDYVVSLHGGAGVIKISDTLQDIAFTFVIPATVISAEQEKLVKSYVNSTSFPVAKLQKTSTSNDIAAPVVASFSSRGPNLINWDILKPDITAPGVDILAAWSKNASMKQYDTRFPDYNIISGTSMSCPHATGTAAYVKSYHPDWSPAAIKSALITSAFTMHVSSTGNEGAEFGYGAGQISPTRAVDPGLVYDIDVESYIILLCSEGYDNSTLSLVTGISGCPHQVSKYGARELNYPSLMAVATPGVPLVAKFPRTVTNVGPAEAVYKVTVNAPLGTNVTVQPDKLSFKYGVQKLSFNVTIEGGVIPMHTLFSGALTWGYQNYTVRSPMLVYCKPPDYGR